MIGTALRITNKKLKYRTETNDHIDDILSR